MIRLFHFKNNFIADEGTGMEADYSAIGYFDGLEMSVIEGGTVFYDQVLGDPFQYLIAKKDGIFTEECDYFNVPAICEGNDQEFWEKEENPFVFISFIRLKDRSRYLEKLIKQIEDTLQNEEVAVQGYLTFDSSDAIICIRTKKYSKGYLYIEKYREIIRQVDSKNPLRKSFSICLVKQTLLDEILQRSNVIEDESVLCNLHCLMKEFDEVNGFLDALMERSKESGEGYVIADRPKVYGILGSDDLVIQIHGISMVLLLSFYKNGGLLTHGNEMYRRVFMNVCTEILVYRGNE